MAKARSRVPRKNRSKRRKRRSGRKSKASTRKTANAKNRYRGDHNPSSAIHIQINAYKGLSDKLLKAADIILNRIEGRPRIHTDVDPVQDTRTVEIVNFTDIVKPIIERALSWVSEEVIPVEGICCYRSFSLAAHAARAMPQTERDGLAASMGILSRHVQDAVDDATILYTQVNEIFTTVKKLEHCMTLEVPPLPVNPTRTHSLQLLDMRKDEYACHICKVWEEINALATSLEIAVPLVPVKIITEQSFETVTRTTEGPGNQIISRTEEIGSTDNPPSYRVL